MALRERSTGDSIGGVENFFYLVATVLGEDSSEVGRELGSGEEIGKRISKVGYLK